MGGGDPGLYELQDNTVGEAKRGDSVIPQSMEKLC